MAVEPLDPTDEALVRSVLSGERDRFELLVERYQTRLVNYLYRMVRNLEEAHDLTQEVFIRVYQALDRYDSQYRYSTWLFRVAQNAAIDVIRKRRIQLVPLTRRADEGSDATVDLELPDGQPSALETLQGRELDASIRSAIDALPWEYRELILLRHYGELAYEEIAEVKAMPLGTVKNKLFRASQMLKQQLVGPRDAGN